VNKGIPDFPALYGVKFLVSQPDAVTVQDKGIVIPWMRPGGAIRFLLDTELQNNF
jgi:hypothetical protein